MVSRVVLFLLVAVALTNGGLISRIKRNSVPYHYPGCFSCHTSPVIHEPPRLPCCTSYHYQFGLSCQQCQGHLPCCTSLEGNNYPGYNCNICSSYSIFTASQSESITASNSSSTTSKPLLG